jgi:hypothetical protein
MSYTVNNRIWLFRNAFVWSKFILANFHGTELLTGLLHGVAKGSADKKPFKMHENVYKPAMCKHGISINFFC